MADPGTFSAVAVALYAGHYVGDYWIQTDHQAKHKGEAGRAGRLYCLTHVFTYIATQSVCVMVASFMLDIKLGFWPWLGAMLVSGVTHYMADRREHGLMFKLARRLPGKAAFLELGKPFMRTVTGTSGEIIGKVEGTASLGTGAWALDQSWHIFFGVFVAALIASI